MTKNEIENRIYSFLCKQENHSLKQHMNYDYYNKFWENVSLLVDNGFLKSAKSVDKFCNKLQIKGFYNEDKYYQGISEILFWLYAIKSGYEFSADKKLNNESNNPYENDVDVQIIQNNCKYNIEVKCPNQREKPSDKTLTVNVPYRSIESLEKFDEEMYEIHNEVTQTIIKNSNGQYTNYQQSKIVDNKVVEYLKSCQKKFNYDNDCINVLALSVPSGELQNYYGYLCNPATGIFTDAFPGHFFDKDTNEVKYEHFDKVDVVYLTNIVTGHLKISDRINAWNLSEYCSILLINPYSRHTIENTVVHLYKNLLSLLPNDTLKFKKERDEKLRNNILNEVPIDPIIFFEYLYNYYPLLR